MYRMYEKYELKQHHHDDWTDSTFPSLLLLKVDDYKGLHSSTNGDKFRSQTVIHTLVSKLTILRN